MESGWLAEYDANDLTEMAIQWLTGYPNMAYIPGGEFEMGDHHDDIADANTHLVYVDSFLINKFEITNQQYCDFLNSADVKVDFGSGTVYASSDSSNSYRYCGLNWNNPPSLLRYSGGVCRVKKKREGGRNMSDDPVIMVSWYGAVAYCNWRSVQEGYESCYNLSTWECDFSKHGYRLPTEAEWEYASRGGQHSSYYRFPWGDTISHNQANYYSRWFGDSPTHPYDVSPTEGYHPDWKDGIFPYTSVVGSFPPNGYGLYDMAGNVHEWCNDWYDSDYYYISPYDNPHGPSSGTGCVYRGGSWGNYTPRCRVALRVTYGNSRGYWDNDRGFRIVLPIPPIEGSLDIELSLNKSWMYKNLHASTASNLTANVSVVNDPQSNTSYTYDWEIILPSDVTPPPAIIDGGIANDPFCKLAAPSCDDPNGLSDSGQAFTVRVIVTGDQHANFGQAEAQFGIALLGDVNNDAVVNIADRSIINAFWRTGAAEGFSLRDCDINSDGSVNIADRSIANAVWRGTLGQNSVSSPCPFR